jgi:hypothetical protein
MPGPAAFPYLCPPLGCLSRIHMSTIDKRTDKRPGRQDDEQLSCRGQEQGRAHGYGTRPLGHAHVVSRQPRTLLAEDEG